MPLFHYRCRDCGATTRRLLSPEAAKEPQLCMKCGTQLSRDVKPPSAKVVERLDNGLMPRAVERLADAERIFRENTRKGRE